MSTPPTPAGWYPDPDDSGSQRYWDGSAWTEHRGPIQVPAEEHGGAHRKPEPVDPAPQGAFEPAAFAAPLDRPSAPADNKKLIVGFSAACAGLLAVLILALVYALFLHDPGTTQIASPTTAPAESTSEESTTETSAPGWGEPTEAATETQAPPVGGESVDGPLAFTVTGVETGDTVTSTEAPIEKTAQGEYIVVRMTVLNRGETPAQFIGTMQRLHAGGITYNIDDEATFYVGGGFVELPPGGEATVGVAFDVPPGTVGESIELHFDPLSPGVQLPLG